MNYLREKRKKKIAKNPNHANKATKHDLIERTLEKKKKCFSNKQMEATHYSMHLSSLDMKAQQ